MSEIGAAFSGTRLVIVRRGSNSAADNLSCDVPPDAGVWQRIDNFGDSSGKLPEPVREFLRCHNVLSIINNKFSIVLFFYDAAHFAGLNYCFQPLPRERLDFRANNFAAGSIQRN